MLEKIKTVVVIDDDPTICKTLKLIIESSASYNVICSCDSRQGLSMIREHIPDAVVLDICMPKISGLDLLKEIKEDYQTMHIPVIMLTGNDTSEHRENSIYWFAEAYYTKPILREQLMESINRSILFRSIHG